MAVVIVVLAVLAAVCYWRSRFVLVPQHLFVLPRQQEFLRKGLGRVRSGQVSRGHDTKSHFHNGAVDVKKT